MTRDENIQEAMDYYLKHKDESEFPFNIVTGKIEDVHQFMNTEKE